VRTAHGGPHERHFEPHGSQSVINPRDVDTYRAGTFGQTVHEGPEREIALVRRALLLFWLGSISIGGKSTPLLFEQFRRRGWLTPAHWLEGYTLAKVLPGPTGVSGSIFFLHTLWGPRLTPLLMILYVLPGFITALALSVLTIGTTRPGWFDGAAHGISASALGLLVAATVRSLGGSRSGPLGPVLAALAFGANGLLGMDLLPVLLVVGGFALVASWPRQVRS